MNTLTIHVPVELPSQERIEGIIREEARKAALEVLNWLDYQEAADYWRVSLRTFERKKKKLGLPHSEIDGVKKIWREDLDALLLANMVTRGETVIEFPSIILRTEILARKATAA